MIEEELFRLEREAVQRVREAHDREIDLGGPGSSRRASEAMDAPMLEAAAIRKMRQRFGDLRVEIDHQENFLRKRHKQSGLPPEVLRHRRRQAEAKLASLRSQYQTLESEAIQRWPIGTSPEQLERRVRDAEGLAGGALHRLKRDIAVSPALTGARKAQLNALAEAAHVGRLSPRDTPRAEDAAEALRRGRPHPRLRPDGGDRRESGPRRPLRPVHPLARAAQPDAGVQREIGRLQGEKAEADREQEKLAHDDSLSSAARRERHRRLRERIAGLDQQIGAQQREAEQLRRESQARKQRAAADAAHWIPMTNGEVDESKLVPGRLYRVEDGSLFVWDGERFGQAQRTDKADAGGRTFRAMPEAGAIPLHGHPGAPETPDEIVANIGRLSEASGVELDSTRHIAALAHEVERRGKLLEDARRRDPDGEQERTRNIERGHRSLMDDLRAAYADAIERATPEKMGAAAMADRMDDPARPRNAGRKFVHGSANVVARAMKGLATGRGSYNYRMLRAMEKLERDGGFKNIRLDLFYQNDIPGLVTYFRASPEERERKKQEIVDEINSTTEGWLYRNAEGIGRGLDEMFEVNPRFEEEFFASKLPEALGKAAAYTGIAVAGQEAGIGSVAATTLVASQELAGQMFDDALHHGATLEQAFRARDLGQVLGLIEAVPIVPLLNKLAPEARSIVLRSFMEAMKSGTEASIKEEVQKAGGVFIQNQVLSYDPNRDVFEGVVNDAKVSFSAGSLAEAIKAALSGL